MSFPSERGQIPGTGAILALLQAATGVAPTVIGKPHPGMYEQAMHLLGAQPATTLMVGDRYETDIMGAAKLGMPTAAVLTGITPRAEFEAADPRPDFILPGLPDLLEAFRQADGRSG
ncbi:MAG: HAD family hydrolase, partial [Caldilineae bacterium]